jgi:hypothetical protein
MRPFCGGAHLRRPFRWVIRIPRVLASKRGNSVTLVWPHVICRISLLPCVVWNAQGAGPGKLHTVWILYKLVSTQWRMLTTA